MRRLREYCVASTIAVACAVVCAYYLGFSSVAMENRLKTHDENRTEISPPRLLVTTETWNARVGQQETALVLFYIASTSSAKPKPEIFGKRIQLRLLEHTKTSNVRVFLVDAAADRFLAQTEAPELMEAWIKHLSTQVHNPNPQP